jgi:RHS repeat-associated protein
MVDTPGVLPAYYRHSDWLGSSRLATTQARGLYYDGGYAAYGEDYAGTGTTDLDFTGQNQDTAAGLYDFLYRKYSPVQGRWISPDPSGLAAVDVTNPQTWNRYAYVSNSPMSHADPTGLRQNRQEGHYGCNPVANDCPFGSVGGTNCILDGVDGSCGLLSSLFHGGALSSLSAIFQAEEVDPADPEGEGRRLTRDEEAAGALEPIDPKAPLPLNVFDWMNPGPLPESIAATYSGGRYVRVVVGPNGWALENAHVWGPAGGPTGVDGTFYSPTPQTGGIQSMIDLGLRTEWGNFAQNQSSSYLPPGTVTYVGIAASQYGAPRDAQSGPLANGP